MYPVLIPDVLIGIPVGIDANNVIGVDRNFPLGPKLFLKDGRWLVTSGEALERLEKIRVPGPTEPA